MQLHAIETTFPLIKLPFDLIANILSFLIKHQDSKVHGSNLIFVNHLFAKAAIPYVWSHLYLKEPTQRSIFNILQTSPSELMFNYKTMVKSVTICPISISNMKSGGLLTTLELVHSVLPNITSLHIEDRLSFCHVCHVGKEATTEQVADLICKNDLDKLIIDSDHITFDDKLLEIITKNSHLKSLSINGSHFTDAGILDYVIPNLKNDLVEFSIGFGGINPVALTGKSVLAVLEHCPNIRQMSLEGVNLNDSDFAVEDLPSSQLEHLRLGKACHQNFTTKGLLSLLSICNKTLASLVLDLDHLSQTVLQDIVIPLFRRQNLQELHLVSESWAEWSAHYPRPRSEQEVKAKEAMWRWKLKAYWGLSADMISLVGKKISTLKVFSILGENHLKSFPRF
ncbi:20481_t:CDS:1 [Dentiscutata erythropus]|uniref:20481_t:CDS:1 n=1 Tax=Dentiscutata erythropus TaxID=1348616 RepID=A0A9N9D1A2_9GLOM|nr:20481_t:CDS:1 [Dentiscutata erythropus]